MSSAMFKVGKQILAYCHVSGHTFPFGIPLRTITSRSIVRVLSQFMSLFGIPKIIQSDQGTNFTSYLFQQVLKQLKIKHHLATVYYPQSQGALERFHQTLKSLLRAYCVQLDRDWEEGLLWLLLSPREVVQERTGFSFWSQSSWAFGCATKFGQFLTRRKNLLSYVYGFRQRLIQARALARTKLEKQQEGMKRLYDRKVERHIFEPGD